MWILFTMIIFIMIIFAVSLMLIFNFRDGLKKTNNKKEILKEYLLLFLGLGIIIMMGVFLVFQEILAAYLFAILLAACSITNILFSSKRHFYSTLILILSIFFILPLTTIGGYKQSLCNIDTAPVVQSTKGSRISSSGLEVKYCKDGYFDYIPISEDTINRREYNFTDKDVNQMIDNYQKED